MSAFKWILGGIGFAMFGPLAGFAGWFIGSMIDEDKAKEEAGAAGNDHSRFTSSGNQSQRAYSQQEMRNGFLFSLLVLATYIIRADGRVLQSEKDSVRAFLRRTFGYDAERDGMDILERLLAGADRMSVTDYELHIAQSARQLAGVLTYEQRLQILAFLVEIAKADGNVDTLEVRNIKNVAYNMGLNEAEVDSLFNLGADSLDAAYKVLEVSPNATDAEIKSAYRKLAFKHHPDRVASLGDDVKAAAEKKFREINAARDKVFAARGIK